jgi:hypothetical protein
MPSKDDDDPASTKDVVTKRQKQLLNREEMDLNLIAESLDGYVLNLQEKNKNKKSKGFGNSEQQSSSVSTERKSRSKIEKKFGPGSSSTVKIGGSSSSSSSSSNSSQGRIRSSSSGEKSRPRRVTPDQTSKYREGGGGKRGQYLRKIGRLPPGSAPQSTKTTSNLPQWLQDMRRGSSNVTNRLPGGSVTGAVLSFIPKINKLYYAAMLGGAVGEMSRSSQERYRKNLATKPTKPGTTISYAPGGNASAWPGAIKQLTKKQSDALTPQQRYMTQAQYDKSIAGTDLAVGTQNQNQSRTTTEVSPQTATAKTPPVDPKVAAAAAGAGAGASQVTRGKTGRTKKKRDRDKFKLKPPGYGGKIGRRSNPQ